MMPQQSIEKINADIRVQFSPVPLVSKFSGSNNKGLLKQMKGKLSPLPQGAPDLQLGEWDDGFLRETKRFIVLHF